MVQIKARIYIYIYIYISLFIPMNGILQKIISSSGTNHPRRIQIDFIGNV